MKSVRIALTGRPQTQAGQWRVLVVAALGLFMSTRVLAADTFWSLVAGLEAAVPFTEAKVEDALGTGLSKEDRGNPPVVVYRTSGFWLKDRSRVDGAEWTPKSGKIPAAVTVTRPAVAARTEACISRADVSREFGAPVRSWNSKVDEIGYTHFEFAQPKVTVSVAFSDITDCLRTLTVAEVR